MKKEEEVRGSVAVAAVVLAAGSSSRMGTAKQLLKLGERTVLESTLAVVRGADVAETVVVLGAEAEKIQREIEFGAGVKVVVNAEYGTGMASSLRAGLGAVGAEIDAALIVLGDQPLVRAETLRTIIGAYAIVRAPGMGLRAPSSGLRAPGSGDRAEGNGLGTLGGAEIVIPTHGGRRGNPVLLDRGVFGEAMALTGDVGCRAIFGKHADGIVTVAVEDAGILVDIDSREDYERIAGSPSR
jgi:molybdenum cofactor cytidylyltransferase